MGMDYIGRNEGTSYHLNWSGHSFIGGLLDQLGADMRFWSGSNDGDVVPERVCNAWAQLLRDNVDTFRVVKIPDNTYSGGFAEFPLAGEVPDPEVALSTGLSGMLLTISRQFSTDPDTSISSIEEADQDTKDWVLDFAAFLEACGGCEQW